MLISRLTNRWSTHCRSAFFRDLSTTVARKQAEERGELRVLVGSARTWSETVGARVASRLWSGTTCVVWIYLVQHVGSPYRLLSTTRRCMCRVWTLWMLLAMQERIEMLSKGRLKTGKPFVSREVEIRSEDVKIHATNFRLSNPIKLCPKAIATQVVYDQV